MSALLITGLIVLYSFQTLFCTLFNERYTGSKAASPYVFCVVEAIAITLVSFAFNGFSFAPSGITVLLSVLNAAMLFVYNTSLIAASRRGSYAFLNVAMLFGGILIPIIYSAAVYGEMPGWLQWAAIAVMLAACFMMNKDDIRLSGTSPVYYLLCLALFVSNGMYGTLLKIQSAAAETESKEMVMMTYSMMGVMALLMLLRTEKKQTLQAFRFTKRSILPLTVCLLSAAAAINLLVFVIPMVNTAVLYTTENGGVLVLSCVYSVLIFREKLTPSKLIGMVLAVISIVALSV